MPLRCCQVPELPGLGSIRLRGGAAGADHCIRWPYVAEDRSFRNWITGGELVFVTGISRHRDPANLAECLYEGKQCGIAGLVVLTGDAYISQLPARLCQLADELALPLFEQPWSLPMVRVTETIGRAILDAEARDRRASAATLEQALAAEIGADRLMQLIADYVPQKESAAARALLQAWLQHRGNQSAMAEALGCHRNTIRNRLQRLLEQPRGSTGTDDHFRTLLLAHLLTDDRTAAGTQTENL